MSRDEQDIRALVSAWMTATREGDVDTVLALMTDDAVFLQPGPPPMHKSDYADVARVQAGAGAPRIDGNSEIEELRVFGDWAFLISRLTVTVTPSDGGRATERAGRTLTVLNRYAGRWRLARDANLLVPVDDGSA